jgi:hypothetical protein
MGDQRGPGLLNAAFGQFPLAAGGGQTGTEAIPVPFQPPLPEKLPGQPGMPELIQLALGIPETAPQRRYAVHYAVVPLVQGAGLDGQLVNSPEQLPGRLGLRLAADRAVAVKAVPGHGADPTAIRLSAGRHFQARGSVNSRRWT